MVTQRMNGYLNYAHQRHLYEKAFQSSYVWIDQLFFWKQFLQLYFRTFQVRLIENEKNKKQQNKETKKKTETTILFTSWRLKYQNNFSL